MSRDPNRYMFLVVFAEKEKEEKRSGGILWVEREVAKSHRVMWENANGPKRRTVRIRNLNTGIKH